jgi:hypothetical protein
MMVVDLGLGIEKRKEKHSILNWEKHRNPNPNHEDSEVQGLPMAYLAATTAFVRDRSRHRTGTNTTALARRFTESNQAPPCGYSTAA